MLNDLVKDRLKSFGQSQVDYKECIEVLEKEAWIANAQIEAVDQKEVIEKARASVMESQKK